MKIAVASCTHLQQDNVQPVWSKLEAATPDALLLGDNIYLENDGHYDPAALAAELRSCYQAQAAVPSFASLVSDLKTRDAPLIAIYDDHDFLGNNRYGGEHDPALREAARRELIAAFAPLQQGNDVYSFHSLTNVDLIVLDERFYRQSPFHSPQRDADAIVGAQQWEWLEDVVRSSTDGGASKYLLIASSTMVHRSNLVNDSWKQYPAALARLVTLLKTHKAPLVVSGDIHRNELHDQLGFIEIVTSGAAGRDLTRPRENFAILDFHDQRVDVRLESLKVDERRSFTISYGQRQLPGSLKSPSL